MSVTVALDMAPRPGLGTIKIKIELWKLRVTQHQQSGCQNVETKNFEID
jgi:hypothetical protein